MILPVILSGGGGHRLWPRSLDDKPKQFLNLFSDFSLLQETANRLKYIEHVHAPLILCNKTHCFLVLEQLQQLDIEPSSIMLEPIGRNTAPAITLAALQAIEQGEDPVLLVLPSDHLITDPQAFCQVVSQAEKYAIDGSLITFGIVPVRPETGYGYIKTGQGDGNYFVVERFVEKPNLETALQYLNEGGYYWNSGMFMFKASTILQEMEKYSPEILKVCQDAFAQREEKEGFVYLDKAIFETCPNLSIDYAVMEKTSKARVVPLDVGWSDIGSWSALYDIHPKDQDGNVKKGNVLTEGVKNSYLYAGSRLVAAIGVEDLVIVETADAVLVTTKEHAQDVKHIVEKMKSDQER